MVSDLTSAIERNRMTRALIRKRLETFSYTTRTGEYAQPLIPVATFGEVASEPGHFFRAFETPDGVCWIFWHIPGRRPFPRHNHRDAEHFNVLRGRVVLEIYDHAEADDPQSTRVLLPSSPMYSVGPETWHGGYAEDADLLTSYSDRADWEAVLSTFRERP